MKFQYTLALISALALTCTATPVEGDAAPIGITDITATADKLAAQHQKLSAEVHNNVEALKRAALAIRLSRDSLISRRAVLEKHLADYNAKKNEYENRHKTLLATSKNLKTSYESYISNLKNRKEKTAEQNEADSKKLAEEQEKADKEALRVRQENENLKRAVEVSEKDS